MSSNLIQVAKSPGLWFLRFTSGSLQASDPGTHFKAIIMKLRFNSKDIIDHEQSMKMRKARIYISGKISGLHDLNARKFSRTENLLYFRLGTNLQVINPLKLPHLHDKEWVSYLKEDLRHLLACNAIVVLDDWMDSRGAILEMLIAQAVAIPAYEMDTAELRQLRIGFWFKVWLLIKLYLKRS
jgi:hypothetical protein